MKEKKEQAVSSKQPTPSRSRWKKLGVGLVTAAAVSIGVYGLSANHSKIQAKPSGSGTPIILDQGTMFQYPIPDDATKLIEPGLSPQLDGYVQEDDFANIISIENIPKPLGFGGRNVNWSDSLVLSDGSLILAVVNENREGDTPAFETIVYRISNEGKVVATYNLGTGSTTGKFDTSATNADSGANPRWAYQVKLYMLPSGKLFIKWGGYIAGEASTGFPWNARFGIFNPLTLVPDKLTKLPRNDADGVNYMDSVATGSIARDGTPMFYSTVAGATVSKIAVKVLNSTFTNYTPRVSLAIKPYDSMGQTGSAPRAELKDIQATSYGYIGTVKYYPSYGSTPGYSGQHLVRWDTTGKIVEWGEKGSGDIRWEYDISTNNKLYGWRTNATTKLSELFVYDPTASISTIRTNPALLTTANTYKIKGSKLINSKELYSYTTLYSKKSEELNGYNVALNSVVTGGMDKDFTPISATSFVANGVTKIDSLISVDNNEAWLVGMNKLDSTFVSPYSGSYTVKPPSYKNDPNVFAARVKMKSDFSPIIQPSSSIIIDADTLTTENKDQQLLSGKDNDKPFNIFDSIDSMESIIGIVPGQKWLENRINKNPLSYDIATDTYAPIDWKALGFEDNGKYGPNLVTYFVTDSQRQTTSTSRWVNKVNKQVDYDQTMALGALNFDLPVSDTEGLTEAQAKTNAQTLLWQLSDGKEHPQGDVKVDAKELAAIQKVKKDYDQARAAEEFPTFADYSALIKPYPLTLSYSYEKEGKTETVTRVVTVYVTNETTKVEKEKNRVIYGFNFRYPLKKAAELSDADIQSLAHASSWAYDYQWTSEENSGDTSFTTNRQDAYQAGANEPQTGINNAKTARDDYLLRLTDAKGVINDNVRVELYETAVTLHIRQLIQHPHGEVVVPEEGYFLLQNLKNDKQSQRLQVQALSQSGIETKKIPYTSVDVPVAFEHYLYKATLILPEYYQYTGYQLSETENGTGIFKTGEPLMDFQGDRKAYWLTMYLKPTITENDSPGFYGWSYGKDTSYSQE